jgi:hypothetical protein
MGGQAARGRPRLGWSVVAGGVVGGEEVAAEVTVRVAPDGVDVVGVPLGVVVFGQQPGPWIR